MVGEFRTDLPPEEMVLSCAEAIDALGWNLEAVEANRIVARQAAGLESSPRVEVVLSESEGATDVRIIGTDTEREPLTSDALGAELDRVRDAIRASLDRWVEPAAQGQRVPGGQPVPAGRPPQAGRPSKAGRRWMVPAILAAIVVIGLGIFALANLGGGSDNSKHDLAGSGSDPTSEPTTTNSNSSQADSGVHSATTPEGKGKGPTGSGTPSPGKTATPSLGEPETIRDGDQHFAMAPTTLARKGPYITLGIRVTGIGKAGFDTSGRAFLGTLIGSNGKTYAVRQSGISGCKPPSVKLKGGRTAKGCLPFKVPGGVQATEFRYQPFFIGGTSAQWKLK